MISVNDSMDMPLCALTIHFDPILKWFTDPDHIILIHLIMVSDSQVIILFSCLWTLLIIIFS